MNKTHKKNNFYTQGFTLIELLVTIAIIGLMASLFVGSFRSAGKNSEVAVAAYKLASDIRRVQSDALGLKENSAGISPPGGWGIRFERSSTPNQYEIFADGGNYWGENGEVDTVIMFKKNIYISDLRYVTNGGSLSNNRSRIHITYEPPDPRVWIKRSSGPSDYKEAIITVSNAAGTYSKKIHVNRYGLVDVED